MAANADEIRAALAKFSSHAAADQARVRLAKILVEEKKYDEAVKELAVVDAVAARMMTGYIYELQQKDKDALGAFSAVLNDLQADAVYRAEAKYASARLLIRQKDFKKAQEILKMTLPQSAGARAWEESSKQLLTQLDNGDFK
jgi:predicted negative regulator of RcsB-dependent stress response